MNKQLIITYFEEFKHWLNGGNVQVYYKKDDEPKWLTDEECIEYGGHDNFSHIMQNSLEPEDVLIAIDDEYVKYRKALAEGKTIQMYCKYDDVPPFWDDMTEVIKSIGFVMTKDNYRIKPEESKFKVGDWVRDLRDNSVFQINSVNFNLKLSTKNTVYVHWQPKKGEWCWFSNKNGIPTIGQFLSIETDGNRKYSVTFPNTPHPFITYYDYCEPFLGQLPTSI